MRPRAILLLTTAVLLAACGSDTVPTPAADTATASPSASEAPETQPPRSQPSTPPAPPSPTAQPTPSTPPSSPESPPPAEPEPEPEPAAPSSADVTIVDFDYAPDPVEVTVGGTVTWTNQDSTAHTATVSGGGPDTGAIAAGSSGSITFDAPGTYDYVCQFHPGSMAGSVVVRAA